MPFRPIRRLRLGLNRPNLPANRLLRTANNLFASGQPEQAAPLFAQLAQTMESRGQMVRAANLHARAAHAYADSNAEAESLAEARLALTQFMAIDLTERIPVFYRNITHKYKSKGMRQALQSLNAEFCDRIKTLPAIINAPTGVSQAVLPVECPHCGAPVLSSE